VLKLTQRTSTVIHLLYFSSEQLVWNKLGKNVADAMTAMSELLVVLNKQL